MTERLIDTAIAKVRTWPEVRQTEAAELLLALDEIGGGPVDVDDETLAAIDAALAEVERGALADPVEVEAFFSRFRP